MSLIALLFGLKTAGSEVKKDVGWWLRFQAWRKERDAKEAADKAAKGLVILFAVTLAASCRTIADLSQYCYERPWECGNGTPPPPGASTPVAPTARPPRPTVTATTAPSAATTVVWVNTSKCFGAPKDNPGAPGPTFRDAVVAAENAYCPTHPGHCNPEGRRVLGGWQNDFYDAVVTGLQASGHEAWVDVCGGAGRCGDIQVAPGGTRFGFGYAEGWHVLSQFGQDWDIQTEIYLGQCWPKWWTSAADWNATNPTPVLPQNSPTATAPPAAPTAVETIAPTQGRVAMLPPTISHFNGCTDHTGHCEFALWFKLEVPPDRPQPCRPDQCPDLWHPSGMALTCDHMYTDAGAPAGTFDPRAGRWVSIMWYVCGGRKWDDPRGPEIRMTFPGHCDQPGFRGGEHGDLYNANCFGPGEVTVCARQDAYACADAADYADHDATYNPGRPGCVHGTVSLPGAGSCVGPFTVNP